MVSLLDDTGRRLGLSMLARPYDADRRSFSGGWSDPAKAAEIKTYS